MALVRVTKKGQITLPEDIREAKGIEPGHVVTVDLEGDRIIVEKVRGDVVAQTAGIWAGKAIVNYREARREADQRRHKVLA